MNPGWFATRDASVGAEERIPLRLPRLALGCVLMVLTALAWSDTAVASLAADRPGVAVEGGDRARILAPAGAQVEPYQNVGYRLRVDENGEVEVTSHLDPIASRAPFRTPREVAEPTPVSRVARSVTVGAETEYEAVSRILGWMARHLDYALDRSQSQEPEAVLERRSGYCTGIARLAVALISSVGIPAREVAGYVVEPAAGDGSVRGFHRWIEVELADRGWIYSDPLASHHYVPASYVRLASELVAPSVGLEGLLLEREDRRTPVDHFPPAPVGVTARRNTDRQQAAALRVKVQDQHAGTAILESDRRRLVHSLNHGAVTFIGLDPGRYTLRLMLPGLPVVERVVELAGPVRKALYLPAPTTRTRLEPPVTRKGSP